jgi:signal peptidase I
VPGDEVHIIGKRVYINGARQERWWPEYQRDSTVIPPGDDAINRRDYFGPVTILDEQYFMMGDNRDESYYSRFWGFVERGDVYGKAFLKVWPLREIGLLR